MVNRERAKPTSTKNAYEYEPIDCFWSNTTEMRPVCLRCNHVRGIRVCACGKRWVAGFYKRGCQERTLHLVLGEDFFWHPAPDRSSMLLLLETRDTAHSRSHHVRCYHDHKSRSRRV